MEFKCEKRMSSWGWGLGIVRHEHLCSLLATLTQISTPINTRKVRFLCRKSLKKAACDLGAVAAIASAQKGSKSVTYLRAVSMHMGN